VPVVTTAALVLEDGQRYAARCLNVSMGGAAVQAQVRTSTGQLVRLELTLTPERSAISIPCEIVRAADSEVGLRFLALDRVSLEAILALL
jgi:hypothetical protein